MDSNFPPLTSSQTGVTGFAGTLPHSKLGIVKNLAAFRVPQPELNEAFTPVLPQSGLRPPALCDVIGSFRCQGTERSCPGLEHVLLLRASSSAYEWAGGRWELWELWELVLPADWG